MNQQAIDKLAEWCKLSERGCWKAATYWDGELLRETWHKNGRSWNPLDSDDDCRAVLERFYAVATDEQAVAFHEAVAYVYRPGLVRYVKRIVLASPREKCEAVAKVMGDA